MTLQDALVREFVNATNDRTQSKADTVCYATAVMDSEFGLMIRLDGANVNTPATFTVEAEVGDRVMVTIKNRQAIVTANITHPTLTVDVLKAKTGIIYNGFLTTNEERVTYNDWTHTGITFDQNGIGGNGGNDNKFYITKTGNVFFGNATIVGNITAKSGYLGTAENGFTIDSYGIYSGSSKSSTTAGHITLANGDFSRPINGTNRTGLRFAIGSNFGVTNTGKIYASDTDLSGRITATSGYIGSSANGFRIDEYGIFSGADSGSTSAKNRNIAGYICLSNQNFTRTVADSSRTNLRFAIGSKFGVDSEGGIYASGATISGAITATSLTLGSNASIPYTKVSGRPNLTIYISKNGVVGTTPSDGATGFVVDTNGLLQASNAIIWGEIHASAGNIGGLTLRNTVLYTNGHSAWDTNLNGVYIGSDRISLGPQGKFNVTNTGILSATGAKINGEITATKLTLVGTKINASDIDGLPESQDLSLYVKKDGTIGTIPSGGEVASGSTGFKVSTAGLLTASNAIIWGTIYATVGTIGGFTLKNGKLYTNEHTAYNTSRDGMYLGSDYIALGPGGKFRVGSDGKLVASGVEVSGKITASSGYLGDSTNGFTIDSSGFYSGTKGANTSGNLAISNSTFSRSIDGTNRTGLKFAVGSKFAVAADGTIYASGVNVKGRIEATSGSFSGSLIVDGTIGVSKLSVEHLSTITASLGDITSGSININNNFIVNGSGVVTIKSGSITLGSNFSVNSSGAVTIKSGSITLGSNFSVNSSGVVTIKSGSINIGSDKFIVESTGKLTATDAAITGEITAKTGKIGNFNIKDGKLYTGTHTEYNTAEDGIYIGTDYISFGNGGKFYVGSNGDPHCNGGNIYLDNKSTSNSITTSSNLYFRIDNTSVAGLGIRMSTSSGTVYGDMFLYTTTANKTIRLVTSNVLYAYGRNIEIGSYVGNDNLTNAALGQYYQTQYVRLYATGSVNFNTNVVNFRNLKFSTTTSSSLMQITTSNVNLYNPNIRLTGRNSAILSCYCNASQYTPSISLYSSYTNNNGDVNTTSGLYYSGVNSNGDDVSFWLFKIDNGDYSYIYSERNIYLWVGSATERAFISQNSRCRVHFTAASSGNMGIYALGYPPNNAWNAWMVYMKYNDSTTVFVDKKLSINGTLHPVSNSDIRLKEKVTEVEIESGLSLINKIHLHAFSWRKAFNNEFAGDRWKIGMIADEMELLDPYLSYGGGWFDDAHTSICKKSVNILYLQGYVIKSIQELSGFTECLATKIETSFNELYYVFESHEDRIKRLEEENQHLKEELLKLKGAA